MAMRWLKGFWKAVRKELFPDFNPGRLTRVLPERPPLHVRLRGLVRLVKDALAVLWRGRLCCDSPDLAARKPQELKGTVECSGWALTREGIASVTIARDGHPVGDARVGVRRRDLGWRFPYFRRA